MARKKKPANPGALWKNTGASPKPMPIVRESPKDVLDVSQEVLDELEKENIVPPESGDKVKGILLRILSTSAIVRGYFASPFALARDQEVYEKLNPGTTERQLQVFEKRMDTRNHCDKVNAWRVFAGQIIAGALAFLIVWNTFKLLEEGKNIAALAAVLSSAGIFISSSIYAKKKRRDSVDRKSEEDD